MPQRDCLFEQDLSFPLTENRKQSMNSSTYKNLVREAERLCASKDASATEEGIAKLQDAVESLKREAEMVAAARKQLQDSLQGLVLTRIGMDRAMAALEQEESLIREDIADLDSMVADVQQHLLQGTEPKKQRILV